MSTRLDRAADAFEAWIVQGLSVRDKLVRERDELLARVREIDALLGAIPMERPKPSATVGSPNGDGPPALPLLPTGTRLSAVAAVRLVLERFPHGLTTGELTREIGKVQPLPAKSVAHAVHQLFRQRGEVVMVKEGKKGKSKRVYALKATQKLPRGIELES